MLKNYNHQLYELIKKLKNMKGWSYVDNDDHNLTYTRINLIRLDLGN